MCAEPIDDARPATGRETGDQAEARVRRHLEHHGLKLVGRNYRSPHGEIDLIMQHREVLVFVEVRYRAGTAFGLPAETVDARKQGRLRATAEHYLQRDKQGSKKACRFDIVAVTRGPDGDQLTWLQNAF